MTTEIDRVAAAIEAALATRAYGLYDYSTYQGTEPPYVVRDERTGAVVFRSGDRNAAEDAYHRLRREAVARAAIDALGSHDGLSDDPGMTTLEDPHHEMLGRIRAVARLEALEEAASRAAAEAAAGLADIATGDVDETLARVKVQTAVNIERTLRALMSPESAVHARGP